jgi:hypothetical protein
MRSPISPRSQIQSRAMTYVAGLSLIILLPGPSNGYKSRASNLWLTQTAQTVSKADFDVIEGIFHDGLGTYTEVILANKLIALGQLTQPPFDTSSSQAKMLAAINRLPAGHPSRTRYQQEIANVEAAVTRGAMQLLSQAGTAKLKHVHHTPREYADAKAGDLRLEFNGRADMPVSVKTDKSGKVAVAEGQTPHIDSKWAERYFQVSTVELEQMIHELGFASMAELKAHYLHVARLVALVMMRKLKLEKCEPADFSRARVGDLNALKYLLRQLRHFKHGNDDSRVIIFDRATSEVKWESLLDEIDIERLTADRIAFLPSRPRRPHPIASEFGVKIDGTTVVSFQIKHKRGRARGTSEQYEFSDITTRLRL